MSRWRCLYSQVLGLHRVALEVVDSVDAEARLLGQFVRHDARVDDAETIDVGCDEDSALLGTLSNVDIQSCDLLRRSRRRAGKLQSGEREEGTPSIGCLVRFMERTLH